ncbi:exonuclease RecJ [Granulicatella balaenopterae]|uniref:Single-stranded-DNA-specific exonuclease RecJ n=1 Tax=Granulicatella balaenopterae TaxID=137733 RepID=A0A1H9GS42_9LACT|nr:single-stranded-DNA-specific exonuclease RecJ [Granulicatella balaenopterae]SEQ52936.1 exonuclease RecJ [Granulicatella balaenopterae]
MTIAQLNWQLQQTDYSDVVVELAKELDYPALLIELCLERGLKTKEEIEEFLNPSPMLFHDPYLLYDMEKAVTRIFEAIEKAQPILIYGDYDADGITSTTIMYEALETMGAVVDYYLPDRFVDGYGPNVPVFKHYIEKGIELIITVDCGIAAHEPVEFAMAQGVDVIVTDHHEIPEVLPKSYANIHPRHPEGKYPFGDLCGAGVAFKVATALLGEAPIEALDACAIGTVADLVELRDENRTIVKQGLKVLQDTSRVGLMQLLQKLDIKKQEIDEMTIGFMLAPRLNALGRLSDATPGVRLLTTFDSDEADEVIELMMSENEKRQHIVKEISAQALEQVTNLGNPLVNVLALEGWHEGVLGIVASKIVEHTKRPTIILAIQPDKGIAKGSGRSIEAFNLYNALSACGDYLDKFGGHHMAAGMSIDLAQLEDFKIAINEYAEQFRTKIEAPKIIRVQGKVPLKDVTIQMIDQMSLLKPFGTGNEEPIFEIDKLTISDIKQVGADKSHLKLSLSHEETTIHTISFGKGDWAERLTIDLPVNVIGKLAINEWQGNKSPQLQLIDIDTTSRACFDKRASKLREDHLMIQNALYLVNSAKLRDYLAIKISSTSEIMTWEEIKEDTFTTTNKQAMVILECPINRTRVEEVLQYENQLDIHVIAIARDNVMLLGMPTREQIKQVYLFLYQNPNIKPKEQMAEVAEFLKIPINQLKFILRVFFVAKFVTIENGCLIVNQNSKTLDLDTLEIMTQRKEQMWLEKVFIYSNFADLTKWLMNK